MSSGDVRSREELIAKRDEIIQKLQGEWTVDTSWKSIRVKAFRLGLCLWGGGMIFLLIIFPIMYGVKKTNGTLNMQIPFAEFFGMMALMLFGIAAIGSCCVMIQSWLYRNQSPFVVERTLLQLDKGKGHVLEKIDLESLNVVADTMSTGQGASWIFRWLGPSATLYSTHILASEKDMNAPRLKPGILSNGLELVALLKKLASLNVEIQNQTEHPES